MGGLETPLVVDALGSAYLTHHPEGLRHLEGRAIATLNPTELAHTAGCDVDPGLGVSGSGDVQAGIVTGLLARGADPVQAAVWGAFLHARPGERLAASVGAVGYLASELLGEVPRVLSELG